MLVQILRGCREIIILGISYVLRVGLDFGNFYLFYFIVVIKATDRDFSFYSTLLVCGIITLW